MRLLGLIVAVVVGVVAMNGVFFQGTASAIQPLDISMTTKCIGNANTNVVAYGYVNGGYLYTSCHGGGSQDYDFNFTGGLAESASWNMTVIVTDGRTGKSKVCNFHGTGVPTSTKTCTLPVKKPAPGGPTDHVGKVKLDGSGPIF